MRKSGSLQVFLLLAIFSFCLLLFVVPGRADIVDDPSGKLTYTKSGLTYDFTFSNTSPNTWSLSEVILDFTPTVYITAISLPKGWSDWTVQGFVFLYSNNFKYDISPGDSLGGFKLTFSSAPGPISFTAFFEDKNGDKAASVPIPASGILLGSGLLGLIGFGLRGKGRRD